MTARPSDDAPFRPRPHRAPPGGSSTAPAARRAPESTFALPQARPSGRQPGQVVAAAGSAVVAGARMGRILGRSAWRIARQLPGVAAMEQVVEHAVENVVEPRTQRLRQLAAAELSRLLELPQNLVSPASGEEERVMMLVRDAASDAEPLRTAMTELLDRSAAGGDGRGRDYLFGTIVSQLVPDEARILAALAAEPAQPVLDVVAKPVGRPVTRTVLANVSSIGTEAGLATPADTSTYLARLVAFGLLEFGPARDDDARFARLANDPAVAAARHRIERDKLGSPRIVRKTVTFSPLGREFWSACAPRNA